MAHPLLVLLTRAKVRDTLRKKGVGLLDAIHLSQQVDSSMLEVAASMGDALPDFETNATGQPVGGTILDAILAFLSSDTGKALIALLVKLLLGA